MPERSTRTCDRAITIAFGLLLPSVLIFALTLLHRIVVELFSTWPLSYESTVAAKDQIAAHDARATDALALLDVDAIVGFASIAAFAAARQAKGWCRTATTIAIILAVAGLGGAAAYAA